MATGGQDANYSPCNFPQDRAAAFPVSDGSDGHGVCEASQRQPKKKGFACARNDLFDFIAGGRGNRAFRREPPPIRRPKASFRPRFFGFTC